MTVKQKIWALGLVDSTINALGVAISGYVGGNIVGHPIDGRVLGVMCAWAAGKNLFAYQKQHPLEELIETTTTTTVKDKATGTTVSTAIKETTTQAASPPKENETP